MLVQRVFNLNGIRISPKSIDCPIRFFHCLYDQILTARFKYWTTIAFGKKLRFPKVTIRVE